MKRVMGVMLFLFYAERSITEEMQAPSSEFELDSNLVDSLYQQSLNASPNPTSHVTSVQVTPQLSMMSPSTLELSNRYFDVSYTDQARNFPVVHLGLSKSVLQWGGLSLLIHGKVGYTYKEGIYEVRSRASESRTDLLKLHWLPLNAAIRMEYGFPRASFLKPHVTLGTGAQWLYQTGRLDGIEQGFWIPFYTFSPGITIFDQEGVSDWFGGITFSGTYQSSYSSTQLIRGWSIDVGLNVLL